MLLSNELKEVAKLKGPVDLSRVASTYTDWYVPKKLWGTLTATWVPLDVVN
jgi:hypothetical protein